MTVTLRQPLIALATFIVLSVLYLLSMWPGSGDLQFYPDSVGYLRPAIVAAAGGDFQSLYGRSVGYPAFLYAIIQTVGLWALPACQLILNTITASMIAATTWLATKQIAGAAAGSFGAWLGVGAGIIVLTHEALAGYASFVMPESLYSTLTTASVLFLALLYDRRCTLFAVASASLSFAAYLVKPHWLLATLVVFSLCLLVIVATPRGRVRRVLAYFAASLAVTGPLYLADVHFGRNDPVKSVFSSLTLFCNHLPISVLGMREAASDTASPEDVDALESALLAIIAEGGVGGWVINGVNGDRCLYNASIFSAGTGTGLIADVAEGQRVSSFALRSFSAGLLQDPLQYTKRVAKQFIAAVVGGNKNWDRPMEGGHSYTRFPELFTTPDQTVLLGGVSDDPGPAREVASVPVLGVVGRILHTVFALVSIPIIAGAAILAVALMAVRKAGPGLVPFIAAILVYFGGMATVALVHTFDVERYGEALAPFAILVTSSSLATIYAVVVGWRRKTTRLYRV